VNAGELGAHLKRSRWTCGGRAVVQDTEERRVVCVQPTREYRSPPRLCLLQQQHNRLSKLEEAYTRVQRPTLAMVL